MKTKLAIALAVLFLLGSFRPSVRADSSNGNQVIGVQFSDVVYCEPWNVENMSGSFVWNYANGTISDIATQESGSLFTLEVMTQGADGFAWNFYAPGSEYTLEF